LIWKAEAFRYIFFLLPLLATDSPSLTAFLGITERVSVTNRTGTPPCRDFASSTSPVPLECLKKLPSGSPKGEHSNSFLPKSFQSSRKINLTFFYGLLFFSQSLREINDMLEVYFPIFVLIFLVTGVALLILALSYLFGRKAPTKEKLSTYECGVEPVGDARGRFSVKFYLIAILFIIFDIEVIFLYPWAVIYRRLKFFGLIEMGIFILILLAGYFYVIKKGALKWE
jgi:NADH-quinone oxidoreductase subunit A